MRVSWASQLEGNDAREYDAFVLAAAGGHATQTRAWADVERVARGAKTSFAIVRDADRIVGTALVLQPRFLGVALPWAHVERGPVVSEVEALADVTRAVCGAARARGVRRMTIMPYWSNADAARAEEVLRSNGWRLVQKSDGPHARTLRISVGHKSDAELFAGKSRSQVRWRAGQAEKAGARARRGTSHDWERLREMHAALMRSQGHRTRPLRFWQAIERFASADTRGALFACVHEDRTVAAAVVLRHGPLASYTWGATTTERMPFTKSIPALVAAIRWARDVGCATFDLGGIPLETDDDPKRSAIATFKYDFDRTPVPLVRQHAIWC